MAQRSGVEVATGAVVLLITIGFVVYAALNTGESFVGGYPLHADFDHVDGLATGADVRISGVKVGSVEAIRLDPKTFLADVTLTVQKGISLTDDSSASINSDGLLGGKYISLSSGGDDKILPPGGTITITQGSVSIEALIGKYIFGGVGEGKQGKGAQSGPQSPQAKPQGDGIAPLK